MGEGPSGHLVGRDGEDHEQDDTTQPGWLSIPAAGAPVPAAGPGRGRRSGLRVPRGRHLGPVTPRHISTVERRRALERVPRSGTSRSSRTRAARELGPTSGSAGTRSRWRPPRRGSHDAERTRPSRTSGVAGSGTGTQAADGSGSRRGGVSAATAAGRKPLTVR
ncbi:hypothetical protein GCM10027451_47170 [Geodermatophilus aquaeductus]